MQRKEKYRFWYAGILFLILFSIVLLNIGYVKRKDSFASSDAVSAKESNYIKWVDFDVTHQALTDTMKLDIDTHGSDCPMDWIASLAYLATRNGGNFEKYHTKDLQTLYEKIQAGTTMEELTKNLKYYSYYQEAYSAVLGGMVGEYCLNGENQYGLKAFSPIAKGYYFNHYDDFGSSRSYGYRRKHLGHDLMGSIGTPIVAVESGYVEAVGWNQYGGWRIGIRSFDGKRYHYYAHLRKNHPYNAMYEGKIVNAGEVIGYLGMTGYSSKENVNNIDTPHLHYGLQLIFDISQKDGNNQIWINLYELTKFLEKNRSAVAFDEETKEYYNKNVVLSADTPD